MVVSHVHSIAGHSGTEGTIRYEEQDQTCKNASKKAKPQITIDENIMVICHCKEAL